MPDKKNKIIHVFHGLFFYLDKSMIYAFFKYCASWDHQCVIYLPGKKYQEEFDAFFKEKNLPTDKMFYVRSLLFNNPDRSRPVKRFAEFLDAVKIYWYLWKHFRKDVKVFHGSSFFLGYVFLRFFDCRRILWVCWSIAKNTYSRKGVRLSLKLSCFRKLGKINTLLIDDFRIMSQKLSLKNVSCCSYILENYPQLPPVRFSNRILIGNNGSFADDYLRDVENLDRHLSEPVKKNASVGVMLNYGNAAPDIRKELKERGEAIFGDRYCEWEKIVSIEEYCREMNTYDIYICSHETQSGLGAAEVMLNYGKKVFLSGYNLKQFQEQGFVVFPFLETLQKHPEEFGTPLTLEQLEINRRQMVRHYSPESCAKKWDELFAELSL